MEESLERTLMVPDEILKQISHLIGFDDATLLAVAGGGCEFPRGAITAGRLACAFDFHLRINLVGTDGASALLCDWGLHVRHFEARHYSPYLLTFYK